MKKLKSKKILIVDDEPNIVMSLEYALQKQGYQVLIARNGNEALNLASKHIPDGVLLDIMMPDIDGYETLKRLKENPNLDQVKIIFLSAKNKKTDIEKGLNLGADDYITKPFSIKKIMETIQFQLNK